MRKQIKNAKQLQPQRETHAEAVRAAWRRVEKLKTMPNQQHSCKINGASRVLETVDDALATFNKLSESFAKKWGDL
jgi:hypothetical protein